MLPRVLGVWVPLVVVVAVTLAWAWWHRRRGDGMDGDADGAPQRKSGTRPKARAGGLLPAGRTIHGAAPQVIAQPSAAIRGAAPATSVSSRTEQVTAALRGNRCAPRASSPRVAPITGGDSGIGRAVAVLYARWKVRVHRLPATRAVGCG